MAGGATAAEAVDGVRHSSVHADWRQLAAIGTHGPGIAWTVRMSTRGGFRRHRRRPRRGRQHPRR
ncbi:hypothetical protein GS415_06195 [Rhodococcus hoagii]|nr:hypothetical protein [Prescottella equi]